MTGNCAGRRRTTMSSHKSKMEKGVFQEKETALLQTKLIGEEKEGEGRIFTHQILVN